MGVSLIHYRGVEIIYVDFSNLALHDVSPVIEQAKIIIRNKPQHSVRILTNITNTGFNSEVGEAFKAFTQHNKPYVKASAIVGLSGMQKIMFTAITKFSGRNDIKSFDQLEKAKDWLANL